MPGGDCWWADHRWGLSGGSWRRSPRRASRGRCNVKVSYREGDVYYRLTFPDVRQSFPQIQSFVFVGKNLADENDDVWYFEFVDSYARSAAYKASYGGERRMTLVRAGDLAEMLDLPSLVRELEAAATRRKAS